MNHQDSIEDKIVQETNDQARAEGRFLGKAFWEIERKPGSVFDIPKTEKSERDLAFLRKRRQELKQTRGSVMLEVQNVHDRIEDAIPLDVMPAEAES